ncbi:MULTISPECIES: hypothetical protein [Mycolicibacterium]|uniref:hypothetical protein n=1 Tax=Mycolicibacterium TaxID=1866885 RepID=UPI001CDB4B51|nr:hypothetical protein [Mycolicibacterium fortuitum]UBV20346.1 hypothetical protein H8Z59_24190 [Mycolicibacterium fortuitum]
MIHLFTLKAAARVCGIGVVTLGLVGCSDLVLNPISPEEARRQVVDVSRQITSSLGNEVADAKFDYQSCGINGKPPFKGHSNLGLWMPGADRSREVTADSVLDRLRQHGWETNPDYHSHAAAFTRDGLDVTVWVIPPPKPDDPPNAHVMIDIYTKCRDTFDHRSDGTAFSSTDIRDEIASG